MNSVDNTYKLVVLLFCVTILAWVIGAIILARWRAKFDKLRWAYKQEKAKNLHIARKHAEVEAEAERYKLAQTTRVDAEIKAYEDELKHNLVEKQNELEALSKRIEADEADHKAELARHTAETEKAIAKYNAVIAANHTITQPMDEQRKKTIQLSEKDKSDIEALYALANQFGKPEAVFKLIWSEYIQQPLNDLLTRCEIGEGSGIYKITNIDNKKSYVGRSTNIRKRIIDHVKGAIGIPTIADQYVHHEMRAEGLWNFTFEKICEAPKEELNKLELQYVELFGCQEHGYNRKAGG